MWDETKRGEKIEDESKQKKISEEEKNVVKGGEEICEEETR